MKIRRSPPTWWEITLYFLVPLTVLLLLAVLASGAYAMSRGNGDISIFGYTCIEILDRAWPSPTPQHPHAEEQLKVNLCWNEAGYRVDFMSRMTEPEEYKEKGKTLTRDRDIYPWKRTDGYFWLKSEKTLKAPGKQYVVPGDEGCRDTDPAHRCAANETTREKLREQERKEKGQ